MRMQLMLALGLVTGTTVPMEYDPYEGRSDKLGGILWGYEGPPPWRNSKESSSGQPVVLPDMSDADVSPPPSSTGSSLGLSRSPLYVSSPLAPQCLFSTQYLVRQDGWKAPANP